MSSGKYSPTNSTASPTYFLDLIKTLPHFIKVIFSPSLMFYTSSKSKYTFLDLTTGLKAFKAGAASLIGFMGAVEY